MTVENTSYSISMKECCRPRRGLNPRPPGLQSEIVQATCIYKHDDGDGLEICIPFNLTEVISRHGKGDNERLWQ